MSHPIFRQHNPAQIAMSLEDYAEQIIDLALKLIGDFPNAFCGSDFRVVTREIYLKHDLMFLRV
jgi:hypothetical protein